MSKTNLCFIGLAKNFTDIVCKQLSAQLDMFYANVQEIIEFELLDIPSVEEKCGREYLLKEEMKIINRISCYENTLINIEYSNLNNETNLKTIKEHCLLVYLRLDSDRFEKELIKDNLTKNQTLLQQDLFQDRDFICKNISDMYINCTDLKVNDLIRFIMEQIIKYYVK